MVNAWSCRLRRLSSILSRARHLQARWDWRGWIALAWVLWWGWLYSLMVLETKFPQVLAWLRSVGKLVAAHHR